MADCRETIRELDAFLDEELSDELRSHIHEHVGSCTDCLETFEFHAELKAAIRSKCQSDEMPPGLLDRLERCLQADIDGDGLIGDPGVAAPD